MDQDLVDRIYECSFTPALWPSVLDELAGIAGARGGVFFAANTQVLNWTASTELQDTFAAYLNDGWLRRCTRRACWLCETRPGFLVEQDVWTEEELDANPVYRDFLRPRGLGWSAGMAIPLPTGDKVVFSLEREYAGGPVDAAGIRRLDELRPHLARSALMAARLRLERAEAVGSTLASVGLPAIVLDRGGAVLAVNGLAEGLHDVLRWGARDRVHFLDGAADQLMRQALAGPDTSGAPVLRSFPVRGGDGRAALVAHLVPVRLTAREVFGAGASILVLTPVTMPKAPPADLVRSLFDLTAAEARVACALLAGERLEDIAASGGVSRNTVRTQLRQVLDKTGCTRQAEVVALLSGLSGGIAVTA